MIDELCFSELFRRICDDLPWWYICVLIDIWETYKAYQIDVNQTKGDQLLKLKLEKCKFVNHEIKIINY